MSSNDIQTKLHELQTRLNNLQQEVSAITSAYNGHSRVSPNDKPMFHRSGTAIDGETNNLSDPTSSFPRASLTSEGFHMRELYFLSTNLLIAKLVCPTITADDASIVFIFKASLLHLRLVRSNLPCLLWAIAVLGIAATSTEDKSVIVAHLEAMHHFAGERAISSVLNFLSSAWGGVCFSTSTMDADSAHRFSASSGKIKQMSRSQEERCLLVEPLGLDVLFDDSHLELVIL